MTESQISYGRLSGDKTMNGESKEGTDKATELTVGFNLEKPGFKYKAKLLFSMQSQLSPSKPMPSILEDIFLEHLLLFFLRSHICLLSPLKLNLQLSNFSLNPFLWIGCVQEIEKNKSFGGLRNDFSLA